MARWLKPEVYPLVAAMTFVGGICVFSLTRHVVMDPDVRISKANRTTAILDNAKEGERYAKHSFREYLSHRHPSIFPSPINNYASQENK